MSFSQKLEFGKKAETFTQLFQTCVFRTFALPTTVVEKQNPDHGDDDKVEGKDYYQLFFEDEGNTAGGVEVKALADNSFLKYGIAERFSVAFELFSADMSGSQKYDRQKWKQGSLFEMTNPDMFRTLQDQKDPRVSLRIRSVQPYKLIYYCCVDKDISNFRPYAAVAFENTPALFQRLNEFAKKTIGLDIFEINKIPSAENSFWSDKNTKGVFGNMWNVPLAAIYDEKDTTVTMMLPTPTDKELGLENSYRRKRFEELKRYAGSRQLDYRTVYRTIDFLEEKTGKRVLPFRELPERFQDEATAQEIARKLSMWNIALEEQQKAEGSSNE